MLQEGLEVAAELAAEDVEDLEEWPVGARRIGEETMVEHPEWLKVTIHQLDWISHPTIHQSLAVVGLRVATIRWCLASHCCSMVVAVVRHPQDHLGGMAHHHDHSPHP